MGRADDIEIRTRNSSSSCVPPLLLPVLGFFETRPILLASQKSTLIMILMQVASSCFASFLSFWIPFSRMGGWGSQKVAVNREIETSYPFKKKRVEKGLTFSITFFFY
eukprot:TRINITY_DN338_c6_g1_i1.p1 TRINITY_DN338_c6_g1~~TRINITY_DN338_c6_g1_i1.p1  ORF type:complete len:108 (-),score=8.32 TRINITY_DN338_c6_g1_i1:27-350(-)